MRQHPGFFAKSVMSQAFLLKGLVKDIEQNFFSFEKKQFVIFCAPDDEEPEGL